MIPNRDMTWRQMFREGVRLLQEAGIEEAENDARALLFWAAKMNLSEYSLRSEEILTSEDEESALLYFEALSRRGTHEPLQYITGEAWFYGRSFHVRPGVLIPRFDTELLVESVLPYLKEKDRILDLCTGSGCILITLLLEGPSGLTGTGVDLSPHALSVARENAKTLLNAEAELVLGDLYDGAKGQYDCIVSNPPYIRRSVIPTLQDEVKNHEPHLALDGDEDGLLFYRRITEGARGYLKQGGILAFEIGYDQGKEVSRIMRENGFSRVQCLQDLSGLDRVVMGVKT